MADLIPSSPGDPDDNRDDRDPKVIGLDSDEADDLLGAISSSTARSVLASLHESPATPSDLATEVDTSLQNVQYHLGNLSEAGLIEVADTRYSEKGREMNVYTPADRALVVVAGREDETKGLKGALTRLIGGVGVLGIGAAVVNRLARTESVLPFGFGTSACGRRWRFERRWRFRSRPKRRVGRRPQRDISVRVGRRDDRGGLDDADGD